MFSNAILACALLASLVSSQVLQLTLVFKTDMTVHDGRPFRDFMYASNGFLYPLSSAAVQGPASQVFHDNAWITGTGAYSPSDSSNATVYLIAAKTKTLEIAKRPEGQRNFSDFNAIYTHSVATDYSEVDIDFKHNLLVFGINKTLILFDISVSIEAPVILDRVVHAPGPGFVQPPNGISINKYLVCAALEQQTCSFQCSDISTGKFGPIRVLQNTNQTGCTIRTVEVYDDFIVAGGCNWGNGAYLVDAPNSVFIWDRATFKQVRVIPGRSGWITNFFRVNNTLVWANFGDQNFGVMSLVNVATAPYIFATFNNSLAHSIRWFGQYLVMYSYAIPMSYYTVTIDGIKATQADSDEANYGYFTPTLALVNNTNAAFNLSSGVVAITTVNLNVRDTYAENSFAYVRYAVVKMPAYLSFANAPFTNSDLANGVSFKIDTALYANASAPKTDAIVFSASNGRGAQKTVTVAINCLDEPTTPMPSPTPSNLPNPSKSTVDTVSDFINEHLYLILAVIAGLCVAIVACLFALWFRNKRNYEQSWKQ